METVNSLDIDVNPLDKMDFEEQLIDFCFKHKCFWDKNSFDYKEKRRRHQLWEDFSKEVNQSVARCKSRWRSLRNTYRIEYGKEVKECRITPWRYYDRLHFLKPFQKKHNKLKREKRFTSTDSETQAETTIEQSSNEIEMAVVEEENPDYINEFLEEYEIDNSKDDESGCEKIPINAINTKNKKRTKLFTENNMAKRKSYDDNISFQLKSALIEATKAINSKLSADKNNEIVDFFKYLTTKVNDANLNRDEMNDFQEGMLHFVNERLKQIKNSR